MERFQLINQRNKYTNKSLASSLNASHQPFLRRLKPIHSGSSSRDTIWTPRSSKGVKHFMSIGLAFRMMGQISLRSSTFRSK